MAKFRSQLEEAHALSAKALAHARSTLDRYGSVNDEAESLPLDHIEEGDKYVASVQLKHAVSSRARIPAGRRRLTSVSREVYDEGYDEDADSAFPRVSKSGYDGAYPSSRARG